jgi:hypothetical protein
MKKIIPICAECKRELNAENLGRIGERTNSRDPDEEVVHSHGICFECGVKLYGREIMARARARMSVAAASNGA